MILESFLEYLEYFRPFDTKGKCLTWKMDNKRLTYSNIDESNC